MNILTALRRALRSLSSPPILLLLFVPFFLALLLWVVIFFVFWGVWLAGLTAFLDSSWLFHWVQSALSLQTQGALEWVSGIFLILIFLPLTYLTSVLLTSLILMPVLVSRLNRRDYADLEKKRGGSFQGSLGNTLIATGIYVGLFVLTLPLWLLPGFAMGIPVLLNAWLNRRIFAYDSLQDFASREERKAFLRGQGGGLFGLGVVLSLLSYVPFLSFLMPVFSGLAYTHYCLDGLRIQRRL